MRFVGSSRLSARSEDEVEEDEDEVVVEVESEVEVEFEFEVTEGEDQDEADGETVRLLEVHYEEDASQCVESQVCYGRPSL